MTFEPLHKVVPFGTPKTSDSNIATSTLDKVVGEIRQRKGLKPTLTQIVLR